MAADESKPPVLSASALPLGASLLAAALTLPGLVGTAHAESAPERGTIALKYLDYLDSQPGIDRVRVKAPSLSVVAPLSSDWALSGTYIHDSISGASPSYHATSLGKLTDVRRAGSAEVTRYDNLGTLRLGVNVSSESDYLSRSVSLTGTRSTEDKNTTYTLGLGFAKDAINPNNRIVKDETKRVFDALLGVTQVLSVADIVQLNLGFVQGSGYYSDPYKVFDNRPRRKNAQTVLLRWNHRFDDANGTLRSSWRHYRDTYGVRSHTLGFEYVQSLPWGVTLTPQVRLYTQSAARFYVNADASSEPFPPNPPQGAEFSSLDHRLSGFGARTLGLKVAKAIGTDWIVDLKVEHYEQRGSWRVFGSGSPGLAPFRARSIQAGVSAAF